MLSAMGGPRTATVRPPAGLSATVSPGRERLQFGNDAPGRPAFGEVARSSPALQPVVAVLPAPAVSVGGGQQLPLRRGPGSHRHGPCLSNLTSSACQAAAVLLRASSGRRMFVMIWSVWAVLSP